MDTVSVDRSQRDANFVAPTRVAFPDHIIAVEVPDLSTSQAWARWSWGRDSSDDAPALLSGASTFAEAWGAEASGRVE